MHDLLKLFYVTRCSHWHFPIYSRFGQQCPSEQNVVQPGGSIWEDLVLQTMTIPYNLLDSFELTRIYWTIDKICESGSLRFKKQNVLLESLGNKNSCNIKHFRVIAWQLRTESDQSKRTRTSLASRNGAVSSYGKISNNILQYNLQRHLDSLYCLFTRWIRQTLAFQSETK